MFGVLHLAPVAPLPATGAKSRLYPGGPLAGEGEGVLEGESA